MEGSLYIVDALNYLFRAFHALPPFTTTKGVPTSAVYGLAQMLLRIEREQRPTHLCVVFDAPGPTFRAQIFSGYKADRPPMPPELAAQVELTHKLIDTFSLPVLSVPGVEADDVIATLARAAAGAGLEAVICSSDKDLMQLCCGNIRLLDTMRDRMIGPAEVQEKFGVPPERVGDVLALMGDNIDNVPGVAGIGPKTAAELITRFGDLTGLLAHIDEVKTKKGQAIAAAREAVLLSRQLVALREDVPLPKALGELQRVPHDFTRLRALFRELEFTRLLPQLDELELMLTPKPAAAVAPAPMAPVPDQPTSLVLDEASLRRLVADVEAAASVGVAVLADGPDPARAGIIGLAFALPAGARHYLPLGHQYLGAPATLRETEALPLLAPLFASERIAKLVHDGKFLEVLLRARGGMLAGVTGDSMLAAYLLDASRTQYALEVVAQAEGVSLQPRSTWLGSGRTARAPRELLLDEAGAALAAEAAAALALGPRQDRQLTAAGLDGLYRTMELPLAHVLARVESCGVRLDADFLRQLGQEVAVSIGALEAEIHQMAGAPFNIGSPKQLADVLFGKLNLPIVRRTATKAPSTDADVLEELAALHPVPAKIVEYRMLTKLKGTYIDALPALVNPRTGRLHTTFNQAVAATGRLSSSDPNLQNIPIRTEVGRRIREAFVSDPGYQIVSADYSQIELRILAHFSEDPDFLDAFRSGQDIHQRTASQVFGVALASVTADQRRIAKAINFGLVFGQQEFGLAQVLRIPRAEARQYIESYFQRYAGVRAYMERAISDARRTGEVTTLLGRRRPLPEIRATRVQDRNHAERIARNSPIQGTAADLLKLAMIRVDAGLRERWPDARLLLTVHDELVFEVKSDAVDSFSAWVKNEMESVYELRVPLVVDVGAGPTWGSAH